MSPTSERRRAEGRALRSDVMRLLAHQARPGLWTWFAAAPAAPWPAPPADRPDLVIEVGGRVVYVEIRAPHMGPLPAARRAWQAAARVRGAAVATVRSVPDLERLLAGLGVPLRKPTRLAAELASGGEGRKVTHGEDQTGAHQKAAGPGGSRPGAADAANRGPAAP